MKGCVWLPISSILSEKWVKDGELCLCCFSGQKESNNALLTSPAEGAMEPCVPLPLNLGDKWNEAIMKVETSILRKHRHVSCGVNLCVIFHSQSSDSAGFHLPTKRSAGTSNISLSCLYHRGREVSSIKLYFVFRILYLWFEVGLLLSQLMERAIILQSS